MKKTMKTRIVAPTILMLLLLFSGIGFPGMDGPDSHESHHPAATSGQDPPREVLKPVGGMDSPMMGGGIMGGGMMSGMMQGMMNPGQQKKISVCGLPGPIEPMANRGIRCEGARVHDC